ncbi:ethylene-responsive transcription factor 13-like [Brachypodium distachyon]|uniref:ethylene-responsive transcription factor 13-like n=1 Tax=Brachypodium distachyon TaxID=15368 RepID=UPI000D0CC1B1|nr:ethylene-responsive transcription factor 13-like [Brachypodium distachyon]|eukprot:XP_024310311.1 ethylene-responsive transcription factor 13-like [Brachypodium distachyon]
MASSSGKGEELTATAAAAKEETTHVTASASPAPLAVARGYRGVRTRPGRRKFVAEITRNKRRFYLGSFDTPEEAARAYDSACFDFQGKSSPRLNFPHEAAALAQRRMSYEKEMKEPASLTMEGSERLNHLPYAQQIWELNNASPFKFLYDDDDALQPAYFVDGLTDGITERITSMLAQSSVDGSAAAPGGGTKRRSTISSTSCSSVPGLVLNLKEALLTVLPWAPWDPF